MTNRRKLFMIHGDNELHWRFSIDSFCDLYLILLVSFAARQKKKTKCLHFYHIYKKKLVSIPDNFFFDVWYTRHSFFFSERTIIVQVQWSTNIITHRKIFVWKKIEIFYAFLPLFFNVANAKSAHTQKKNCI